MYVEGRVKDVVINESGENVYPDEVEDAFALLSDVEQLCVLGIPVDPAQPLHQEITLVMHLGDKAGDEVYVKGLCARIAQINGKLPVVKQVNRVLVSGERLPVVNAIKVKRVELRRLILEHPDAYRELSIRPVASSAYGAPRDGVKTELVDLEMRRSSDEVRKF
jgi:acyl-CoA synthetase (AMP-forming)/AMP-acid ligase II